MLPGATSSADARSSSATVCSFEMGPNGSQGLSVGKIGSILAGCTHGDGDDRLTISDETGMSWRDGSSEGEG